MKTKICPITGHQMDTVFSAKLLNKYDVQYFYCEETGLLQTEEPYWLDEAYDQAIAATDTGILRRNFLHLLRSLPLYYHTDRNSSQYPAWRPVIRPN